MYRPRHYNNYPQNFTHSNQWRPNFAPRGQFRDQRPNFWRPPLGTGTINNNEEHWCETCDRGFPSMNMLEKHKQQHQKCNIDGCQFIAHPKVITKHIQMQHSSGLFKKIANLNNPEEINKWLEERKKKYPTKLNVEKKAAELKEKIERGEKMGLKYDKYNKNSNDKLGKRKQPFGNQNNERQKRTKIRSRNPKNNILKTNKDVLPSIDDHRKLKPFAGIQDLIDFVEDTSEPDDNFIIDDDEFVQEKYNLKTCSKTIEPTICGALSSLICDYGSSEEEIDTNKTRTVKETRLSENQNSKENMKGDSLHQNDTKLKDENDDEDSAPEEVKVDRNQGTEINNVPEKELKFKRNERIVKRFDNKQNKKTMRPRSKLPSTLLQKLLHKEIQQERNTVLQCIRYVVNHNFFDSPKNDE